MPNIPNTNTPGLLLLSNGDGQNGSHWGVQETVSGNLAMHYIAIDHQTSSISYYLRDVGYFLASGEDGGALTSLYSVPQTLGPSPWGVCAFTSSPNVYWTNVDTSATARTITLTVIVQDSTGSNRAQVTMTATLAMSGTPQSYSFSSTDFSAATVSIHGSDLTWNSVGTVYSASGTIEYVSILTWLLQ